MKIRITSGLYSTLYNLDSPQISPAKTNLPTPGVSGLDFVSGFKFFSGPKSFIAKKDVSIKMDVHIWQLITAICAPHSTVTCMYRATSMNHTRLIFVMNFNGYYLLRGIRLRAYLANKMLLKDNVICLLLNGILRRPFTQPRLYWNTS